MRVPAGLSDRGAPRVLYRDAPPRVLWVHHASPGRGGRVRPRDPPRVRRVPAGRKAGETPGPLSGTSRVLDRRVRTRPRDTFRVRHISRVEESERAPGIPFGYATCPWDREAG